MLISATAYGKVRVASGNGSAFLRGTMTSVESELGYNHYNKALMARLRVGSTFVLDPLFLTIAPYVEVKTGLPFVFGLQTEMMHLETGLWLQAGAMVDIKGRPGGIAAAGWSIFGVEYQKYNGREKLNRLLFIKLKLPFSFIYYATEQPWNK